LFILRRWTCTFNILSLSLSSEQQVIIQFLPKEKIHPTQIHRRLAAHSGLETYSLRSVQCWCQLFDCGRQNLRDDPKSGRAPVDHLDAKPITCLEAMDVSPATILSRLHNSLGMTNFHLHSVPHKLTDDLRRVRVTKCGEPLRALEPRQGTNFRHITTSQAMRAGFTFNTSTPQNGRSLAMKCLKGWTRLSALLSLCSRLFGSSRAFTCWI
jgi:hypothetical protein